MSLFVDTLLAAWYYGTLPYRWWSTAKASAAGCAPAMVLFYHRVADTDVHEWTITTAEFKAHLDWLQENFEIVSLSEAQDRLRSGKLHAPTVSLTFDDGYAENCRDAIPEIVRRRLPCTYFVATEHIRSGRPFQDDLELGLSFPPNTIDQLRAMVAAGIEIGSHTRTHPNIGEISDPEVLRDEMVTSRDELSALLGTPIDWFAFPYGQAQHMSAQAFRVARRAGYRGVCSAYGGYNFPGEDSFHLQRIHGDPGWLRLRNWLSIDPRKIAQVQRVDFPSPLDMPTLVEQGARR